MLYGCTESSDQRNISSSHRSIHSHVLLSICQRRPGIVDGPRDCAHRILGSLTDYPGEASNVKPYGSNLISIPDGSRHSVPIASVLRPETWESLNLENILLQPGACQPKGETPGMYTDEKLRQSRPERMKFYMSLIKAG
eukprot:11302274-Karenia_brevis.AAC.1